MHEVTETAGARDGSTVSIVVPVYYNELSVPPLFAELQQIEAQLLAEDVRLQLIFVDDGSRDDSFQELLSIKRQRKGTTVVKLTRNFGAVHATKTGFRFVEGDCFMVLAADLQDPPSLILEMVKRWKTGSKYVVCARTDRRDPPISKLFSAIYYKLVRLLVVTDYPQRGYDMALMDRDLLKYLMASSKNINTPLFAFWLGFKPDVIEYARAERVHGKSRWTFKKRVKFFLDSLLGFSIAPIRAVSALGLVVSLVSFGYGVSVIIARLRGDVPVAGFAALTALIAFLLGIVILTLGVIGEYVWRIFDEVSGRPESVIDEVL